LGLDEAERTRLAERLTHWTAADKSGPIVVLFGHSPARGFEGSTAFPCRAEVGADESESTSKLKHWGFSEPFLLDALRVNLLSELPESGDTDTAAYKELFETKEADAGTPRVMEVLKAIQGLDGSRRIATAVFGPAARKAIKQALDKVVPAPGKRWWVDASGGAYVYPGVLSVSQLGLHELRIISLPHPSKRNRRADADFTKAEADFREWQAKAY